MISFPYYIINDLPETQFIAGTNQEFTFAVYDSAGVAVDLNGATLGWEMAHYGQSGSVLSKSGVYSGSPNNEFKILLTKADTISLSGKFVHQNIISDFSGSSFRPSQGIITIIPAIV